MSRIVAVLLAIALLAAACGDGGDEIAAPVDPVQQPAEEPTTEPTTAPSPAPSEEPTKEPSPTPKPTEKPTQQPTATPTPVPSTPTPTPKPTTPPDDDDDHLGINVTWNDPSAVAKLPDGWTIAACQGDAPMLCVSRGGEHRAVIEATSFPVSSFPFVDPGAGVHDVLRAIRQDFMQSMAADRAIGCGQDYQLTPRGYEKRTVGRSKGAKFGFDGALADGTASEADIHYATVVDDRIVMIVASAYNPKGCLAPDENGSLTTKQLAKLEPYIDEIVANSKLPQSVL